MITAWRQRFLQKVLAPEISARRVEDLRREGKTIATVNGSFDLMHAGHLHILYEASLQADILIALLNTDASVRALKGEERPFIPLESRLQMVAAIECVSYVSWFHETDPRQALATIRPDVHVNGAEYGENCLEAAVVKQGGGRIHLVDRLPGLATTEIALKIRKSASCVS